MHSMAWGGDLDFYDNQKRIPHDFGDGFFISAGKANRDHDLLAKAAGGINAKTVIVCSDRARPHEPVPENVSVLSDTTGHAMSYLDLLSAYRSALAVVIPLVDVDALAGLTSLVDAIACGKAVVMTRNPYIDIDIESLGFGFWVEPGDVLGMQRALERLATEEGLAHRMGQRARAYAESEYNYLAFSERLAASISDVFKEKHS